MPDAPLPIAPVGNPGSPAAPVARQAVANPGTPTAPAANAAAGNPVAATAPVARQAVANPGSPVAPVARQAAGNPGTPAAPPANRGVGNPATATVPESYQPAGNPATATAPQGNAGVGNPNAPTAPAANAANGTPATPDSPEQIAGNGIQTGGIPTALLDPPGANNGIQLAGYFATAEVVIDATTNRTQLTATATGGDVVITSGDQVNGATLAISGTLSPDVSGVYLQASKTAPIPLPMLKIHGAECWSTDGNNEPPVSGAWSLLVPQYLVTPQPITINELMPPGDYLATADPNTASQLVLLTTIGGQFGIHYLSNFFDPPQWVNTNGGAPSGDNIIPAGTMVYPNSRLGGYIIGQFVSGPALAWIDEVATSYLFALRHYVDGVRLTPNWGGIGDNPIGTNFAGYSGATGDPEIAISGSTGTPATAAQGIAAIASIPVLTATNAPGSDGSGPLAAASTLFAGGGPLPPEPIAP